MKKCAQCGSDYPLSNNSCPHCGYGEAGFANGAVNQVNANVNKNSKMIKIIIIVVAVVVIITALGIISFSRFLFNNITDMADQQLNNGGFNTSSAEECSDSCDGSYVYMNGTCSCMNVDFE